jgi:hypothetical protein
MGEEGMRAALVELIDICGPYADAGLSNERMTAAIAAARAAAAPSNNDGPYRPALAEAFRVGARELCNCNLGDRIEVPADALVEEGRDGGAYVTVRLYVSDSDRVLTPAERREHIEDEDGYPGPCTDPNGHDWPNVEEGERCLCTNCGADGDA